MLKLDNSSDSDNLGLREPNPVDLHAFPTIRPRNETSDSSSDGNEVNQLAQDSSASSDTFDPELHSWNYKNHKRPRVEYRSMKFQKQDSESEVSDLEKYQYSPPPVDRSGNDIEIENRMFKVHLRKIGHSKHSQFNYRAGPLNPYDFRRLL